MLGPCYHVVHDYNTVYVSTWTVLCDFHTVCKRVHEYAITNYSTGCTSDLRPQPTVAFALSSDNATAAASQL